MTEEAREYYRTAIVYLRIINILTKYYSNVTFG